MNEYKTIKISKDTKKFHKGLVYESKEKVAGYDGNYIFYIEIVEQLKEINKRLSNLDK